MTSLMRDFELAQVLRVWKRNFLIFKRTWMVNIFWVILEPSFFLLSVGIGLGAFVDAIGGHSYTEWYFPGLMVVSCMMVSYFESTYGNFTKLTYSRVYNTQLLTPVTPTELVIGEIFWSATKGTLSGVGVIFVGMFFGLGFTLQIFLCLPVLFLTAWIFSAIGMVVTASVKNYDQITYPTSGLIVPISLFSSTYFPTDSLPAALKYLTYLSPLSHSANINRILLLGESRDYLLFHIAALVVLAVGFSGLALKKMYKRVMV